MRILGVLTSTLVLVGAAAACGTSSSGFGSSSGSSGSSGITLPDSGSTGGDGGGGGSSGTLVGDPTTCEEAASAKTYVGCDYWPTVTANGVDSVFDFAVVIGNSQATAASVTVTGPGNFNKTVSVAPGTVGTVYLPWVSALKGSDTAMPDGIPSALARSSAYHLVSSVPVIAYQFSPLEYKAKGGPPGKDWSSCVPSLGASDCYSYSNDASLLLPSTAMTGNYRVIGPASQTATRQGLTGIQSFGVSDFFTITATADATNVTVNLAAKASIKAGSGVTAKSGGGTYQFSLNAGDVVELFGVGGTGTDVAGSLVKSDKPVQVLSGVVCGQFPYDSPACDHTEEVVFPVETLGKSYFVVPPTGPLSSPKVPGALVRIHGNFDNTVLTYAPSKPAGCPATINAGQVVDCGSFAGPSSVIKTPFHVTGDQPFAVSTYMVAGALSDPNATDYPKGDPSQSTPTAVEQYRKDYLFLAPANYDTSFVDVVAPTGTTVTLDGAPVSAAFAAIADGFGIARVAVTGGSHKLVASEPVGIQVMGYGDNTSYQYPGGLNLSRISDIPDK